MKTSKLLLAALIGASLALSACATVKGAGKDIQSVGQAGEDAIDGK
ncbi:MAG: entericidin A/B family lipoprotein [Sphingobium sp.]|nr:entericidin A/B family lipoprotein [Sphingobium sp.]